MGRGAQLGVDRQEDPRYRTHVLTYSPDLLRMEHPCRLEQLDEHRFRIRIEGDRHWFSGALGRFLIEALRPSGRLNTGDEVRGELFDAVVRDVDGDGVRELEFVFHEPLASERFCFYLGTPSCAAARVRFAGPISFTSSSQNADEHETAPSLQEVEVAADRLLLGDSQAALILFRAAEIGHGPARDAARAAIEDICEPVAEALGAPVLQRLPSGQAMWSHRRDVARWWSRHVDDQAVLTLPGHRDAFESMRQTRDSLFRIRQIASHVIRSDLYLTGPPFAGPR
jgi:hypothetical protein